MRTVLLLIAAALLQLAVGFFAARPDLVSPTAFYYLRATAIIGTAMLLVRLVSQALIELLLPRLLGREPDEIFKVIIVGLCYGIAGAIVLRLAFGQDMATILTASALFTAIIGLALQATLNNLFSGTALQLERSFRIGDLVRFGQVQGHIEALHWRSMHLRTIDNSLLIIPNSQLNTALVEVFRAGSPCRHAIRLPAPLVAPPALLLALIQDVLAGLADEGRLMRPEALLDSFAGNEGATWFKIFFHTERFLDGAAVEAEIRTRYWYALSRRGLAIALSSVYAGSVTLPDDAKEIAGLLARLPDYCDLDAETLDTLARRACRLSFADGEPIALDRAAEPAQLILHRGAICLPGVEEEEAAGGKLAGWNRAELARITAEFADIMGPIAELLVHRAADRTRDPYVLYRRLAAHIENAAKRDAFLACAPSSPSHVIEPHTLVSSDQLLPAAGGAPPHAIGHTELLALHPAIPELAEPAVR
jgi:small-conductance mechanosensitive channel